MGRAVLWEDLALVDLNTLIPADSGLELQSADWINDDGVIAAQAVLTQGNNAGASRAVLLIPDGESDRDREADSTIRRNAIIPPQFGATQGPAKKIVMAVTEDGRVNSMLLRRFDPAKLLRKAP